MAGDFLASAKPATHSNVRTFHCAVGVASGAGGLCAVGYTVPTVYSTQLLPLTQQGTYAVLSSKGGWAGDTREAKILILDGLQALLYQEEGHP